MKNADDKNKKFNKCRDFLWCSEPEHSEVLIRILERKMATGKSPENHLKATWIQRSNNADQLIKLN